MNITKNELINKIAEMAELTAAQSKKAVEAFNSTITDVLRQGGQVSTGLGNFKVTERAARKGRNPRTGEEIQIPASKSPTFKAGKALKDELNK